MADDPLRSLEYESIAIMREAAATAARPAMLQAHGADSAVMLHLARKSFHPVAAPFPLLQEPLDPHPFDLVLDAARPHAYRAEPWNLCNARMRAGETIRVFPLRNWTDADLWRYIVQERIEIAQGEREILASRNADLVAPGAKQALRVVTCGGADDGKSTLIDRLLRGSRSAVAGARRRFIVADAPGQEESTRDIAIGASTADAAVIVVDARKGLLTQARRHTRIAAMMGIGNVALAVNKMDLVGFDAQVFQRMVGEFAEFARRAGIPAVTAIPVCALDGDNVARASERMPWHAGPTLLDYLDNVAVEASDSNSGLRMPVQWVNRSGTDFRGFSGLIAEGEVAPGDTVRILPSGVHTRVAAVYAGFESVEHAGRGHSVTVTLADDVDASRGDVLCSGADAPQLADQFEARLLWMGEHEMIPGRPYILKIHAAETTATITLVKYREDIDTGAHLAARTLRRNDIGVVNVSTALPIVFEPYSRSRTLGAFTMIDKLSFETVGAGMIDFALRRAANLHWQAVDVDRAARARMMHQKPRCVWFTGLSGAGKSTIANLLEKRLHVEGRHTYLLDGDNVRHGLNRDLGFTDADRVENIRRVAEVARLMVDAGLVVLVSFISPFRGERRMARQLFAEGDFIEVFVDTPLEECERRDTKGLYAKARRGELANFTGIDSGYEPPEAAELRIDTLRSSPQQAVDEILQRLRP